MSEIAKLLERSKELIQADQESGFTPGRPRARVDNRDFQHRNAESKDAMIEIAVKVLESISLGSMLTPEMGYETLYTFIKDREKLGQKALASIEILAKKANEGAG